ncbi:hypothetical protein BT96DRAFT_915845 [Gymnopus androsaceus JB14]|uniref:Uncharacterized protein n=1 Tax=Gymnopus androsaceus JB14 TaxID=1447944 RepID=A0A6A4I9Z3_9AGAR|nr:hypothetical protein BT96DRAFT_915845 [Gymnopus androsaceus JB14]
MDRPLDAKAEAGVYLAKLQQQGGDEEEVGMYGIGRDGSQAVLLRKMNQSKLSNKYRHP